ncbi:SGNH/GDSL hydrolase family protein [Sphingomonas canadensis]|uniref:SGNH/GDSL hydrolase family protein n=1 Tax=Sphingomonas canadensis TaxID=1219257 RepID=A0ABW3H467_9SPHN|nr:SGNH/GDSL hydrolase family protein [Sphingomonas canadensis]MCW3835990.1 SGNH/GDSL hydrolase family protein [Sphingomonas canadensis]
MSVFDSPTPGADAVRLAEAETAITALETQVAANATSAGAAVAAEVTARQAADAALTTALNAETDARATADQELADQIADETAARVAGDALTATKAAQADAKIAELEDVRVDMVAAQEGAEAVVAAGATILAAKDTAVAAEAGAVVAAASAAETAAEFSDAFVNEAVPDAAERRMFAIRNRAGFVMFSLWQTADGFSLRGPFGQWDLAGDGGSLLAANGAGISSFEPGDDYVFRVVNRLGFVLFKIDKTGALVGLSDQVAEAVAAAGFAPKASPAASSLPTHTDGRGLHALRGKLAKILQSGAGRARIAVTGDSWTEYVAIPQQLATWLRTLYGDAGGAWLSVQNQSGGPYTLDSVTFSKSGWTSYDASADGAPGTNGCAPDGMRISTTGTSATLSYGAVPCDSFKIFYKDTTGTFRWRVDGGSWTTVTGGGTDALAAVTISGLSAGTHGFDIDCTGNAGTVVIYGAHASKAAGVGVEMLKMGNGGLDGTMLATFASSYIQPIATSIGSIDAVIVIMSTNDYRRSGTTPELLVAALGDLVTAYRAANADTGFIFVAPALSGGTVVTAQSAYRDAIYDFCIAGGHEFLNMHDLWGSYASENGAGMWTDSLHLNNIGAYRLGRELSHRFLEF